MILSAHKCLDEQFAPRAVGLVPVVRPVAFALIPAEGGYVRDLAKVAGCLEFDMFGDVYAATLHFAMAFVFGAEFEHLVVRECG